MTARRPVDPVLNHIQEYLSSSTSRNTSVRAPKSSVALATDLPNCLASIRRPRVEELQQLSTDDGLHQVRRTDLLGVRSQNRVIEPREYD